MGIAQDLNFINKNSSSTEEELSKRIGKEAYEELFYGLWQYYYENCLERGLMIGLKLQEIVRESLDAQNAICYSCAEQP